MVSQFYKFCKMLYDNDLSIRNDSNSFCNSLIHLLFAQLKGIKLRCDCFVPLKVKCNDCCITVTSDI